MGINVFLFLCNMPYITIYVHNWTMTHFLLNRSIVLFDELINDSLIIINLNLQNQNKNMTSVHFWHLSIASFPKRNETDYALFCISEFQALPIVPESCRHILFIVHDTPYQLSIIVPRFPLFSLTRVSWFINFSMGS